MCLYSVSMCSASNSSSSNAFSTWLYILNKLFHALSSVPSYFTLKSHITPPIIYSTVPPPPPPPNSGFQRANPPKLLLLRYGDCDGCVTHWMTRRSYAPASFSTFGVPHPVSGVAPSCCTMTSFPGNEGKLNLIYVNSTLMRRSLVWRSTDLNCSGTRPHTLPG